MICDVPVDLVQTGVARLGSHALEPSNTVSVELPSNTVDSPFGDTMSTSDAVLTVTTMEEVDGEMFGVTPELKTGSTKQVRV